MMMRDGRNPYGSRGGYVVSGRGRGRGRDRAMNEDMARGRGRDRGMGEDFARGGRGRDRAMSDMARGGNQGRGRDNAMGEDYGYEMDYGYDMAGSDYARGGRGRGRDNASDYADYADYGDYAGQGGRDGGYGYGVGMFDYDTEDYGYDMAMGGRDGASKLSSKDLKKWEKELENADGTKGKKWDSDQIKQVAQQHGIRFDEYRPETLTAVANMLYSDYCKVLGADMMLYVKLAKAFLEDDDFEGEPEEKVMLYYKCIVSKDD